MKIIVVMPAYNAEKTVEKTYRDIPQGVVDEVILVDDDSRDNTVEVARELGLTVIEHPQNRGYGGNQKTCYKEALKQGADVVVMIHPDYQYDSRLTPKLIEPILNGMADIAIGSRIRTREEALAGGMPFYKYLGNRFLTLIENIVLGQNLSEFHTGFRAYSRRFLETVPFQCNSDDFVFDTEILVQAVVFGFKIAEIPVPTRYFPEASSINFRRSVTYGLSTLWTLAKYIFYQIGWRCKIFCKMV
ncbi:MAG: glycosyltransferase family 2 protein [bacterium]|nr:glycosyltransferase family 2 protein [bacterium]